MTTVAAAHPLEHPSLYLDRDFATAVAGALWAFEPLRTTKALMNVSVDDAGNVTLSGNVRSPIHKGLAARIARRVDGVISVTNELVSDADIESAIAHELGRAEVALYTDQLNLESRLGTVYLGGQVAATDKAAAEVAFETLLTSIRQQNGVRQVISEARVVEASAAAAGDVAEVAAPTEGVAQAEIQERLRIWKERAAQKG